MNQRSGVSKSGGHRDDEPAFDVELESKKLVDKLTEDMTSRQIMDKAGAHLKAQHPSCYHPWSTKLNAVDSEDSDGEELAIDLLQQLAIIASREALLLSFKEEENDPDSDEDDDMYSDEEPEPTRGGPSDALLQMACFVAAVADDNMIEELTQFLSDTVRDANLDVIGRDSFSVPRALVDFKTGDLLVDPVRPKNAPWQTFVNSASKT
ncbi:hypothetical protein B0H17DRAFT_123059 [Mycena rosella]|uniref:Uncharacterized protein n=1 Tax=Mycena rosella TaxID=1033263 RepID=A0AAD7D4P4_MYCRO|nr:hypothetical protein B0H17DRAFT_123059 [Mycena rosella]